MRLFLETLFVFISTEIDDFLVFVVLFASQKVLKNCVLIFSGRFLAVFLAALISAFASSLLSALPHFYLRFLGLIPLVIGTVKIFKKNDEDDGENVFNKHRNVAKGTFLAAVSLFFSAFLITLVSSGDNAGIYIPFFLDFSFSQKLFALGEISLLNFAWTLLQLKSASLPAAGKIVRKYGRVLVPAVFILLGISVLIDF